MNENLLESRRKCDARIPWEHISSRFVRSKTNLLALKNDVQTLKRSRVYIPRSRENQDQLWALMGEVARAK